MTQTALQYDALMVKAREFEIELSLEPDLEAPNLKIPTKRELEEFLCSMSPSADYFAHKCMIVGSFRPALEKLGFSAGEVTIGYMRYNNEDEFYTTKELLAQEMAAPGVGGFDVHVWITYPDGMIFDPTLIPSFEKDAGTRLMNVSIRSMIIFDRVGISSKPIEMEYIPLLTGSDYLYKTQSLVKPNPKYNSFGVQAADDAFNNGLMKGYTLSLTDAIKHYAEHEAENRNAIIVGLVDRFMEFEYRGLITKELDGESGDTYYKATDAALTSKLEYLEE
jgi:hypothetical protein